MTSRSSDRLYRLGTGIQWIAIGIGVVGAFLYCYYRLFTYHPFYDDDGNNLLATKLFIDGMSLYTEIRTGHGPFFYLYNWFTYGLLRVPVSHDVGRLMTGLHWVATALLCGGFVFRVSRSRLLAIVVFFESILHLDALRYEPGSAQSMLILAMASALFASTFVPPYKTYHWSVIATGFLVACIAATKINVGVFLFVALVLTLLYSLPRHGLFRIAYVLAVLAASFLPLLLIGYDLSKLQSMIFPIIVILSILSVGMAGYRPSGLAVLSPTMLLWQFAAILAGCGALVLLTALKGTTPLELFDGIWTQPRMQAGRWESPLTLSKAAIIYAWVSFAFASIYAMRSLLPAKLESAYSGLLVLAKLIFGFVLLRESLQLSGQDGMQSPLELRQHYVGYVPCMWLLLVPPSPKVAPESWWSFSRFLLAAVATLEILQIYPVAGTQSLMATLYLIPAGAILFGDACSAMVKKSSGMLAGFRLEPLRPWAMSLSIVLLSTLFYYTSNVAEARQNFDGAVPLDLPGSHRLRLSASEVATYTWLANNLRASDTFATLPGIGSLYLWSEKEPPNGMNLGPSVQFLSDAQQQHTISSLEKVARPYFCMNAEGVYFWKIDRMLMREPQSRYLLTEYLAFANSGSYTLYAHRKIPPDSIFETLLFGEKQFDGLNDQLRLPGGRFAPSGDLSMALWFKTRAPGVLLGMQSGGYAGGSGDRAGTPLLQVASDGKLYAEFYCVNEEPAPSSGVVSDGKWHHVVLVSTNAGQQLYLDAKLVGSVAGPRANSPYAFAQLGAGLTEGSSGGVDGWSFFAGTLRDVILAKRALQPSEIEEMYAASK